MSIMRSLLLLVVLLCILCAAHSQAQDAKLKLCGRALLRTLVYTCGGSRWRRQIEEKGTFPEAFLAVSSDPDLLKRRDVSVMDQRDQNIALITTCCQQGCRKGDLAMLC